MTDITSSTFLKLTVREWVIIIIFIGGYFFKENLTPLKAEYVTSNEFDLNKKFTDGRIDEQGIQFWQMQRSFEKLSAKVDEGNKETLKSYTEIILLLKELKEKK